jgi:pimeloyl-ACP methyl ester carboxylesterase
MATIVIVPGATSGGWRWKEVRLALQAAGHEVYALTLTGLGERSHLATPEVGLDTHVQDVVHVLEYEDLHDVVLLGHSYGGVVLTAVADRAADRLARLIYLDAVLPHDGECLFDVLPTDVRPSWEERARQLGEGWRWPPPPGSDRRAVPMPLKPCQQPLRLTGTGGRTVPAAYIHCTAKTGQDLLARSAGRARARGWPVYELATSHIPLRSEAERTALVDLLLKLVPAA